MLSQESLSVSRALVQPTRCRVDRLLLPRRVPACSGSKLACLAITLLLAGCSGSDGYLRIEGGTMGTYYRVTARCPAADEGELMRAVAIELEAVNDEMSTYLPESELSRFNRGAPGVWVPVSETLVDVVEAARTISELSGGAFDVTVGPLVEIWGFGPAGPIDAVPGEETVSAARARVGYRYLQTRRSPPALRKTRDVSVDLSAIAKGHGVDRIALLLAGDGCTDFLVDIGGEVAGRGVNVAGRAWRVGIEVPDPKTMGSVQRVIGLTDVGVATSGDYRNFVDLGGVRYSHTIDARSGRPVAHRLASVSVMHSSVMWADGLATALNVLGPDDGFELAEREGLAALFVIRRAEGFEERYTAAMLDHLDAGQ